MEIPLPIRRIEAASRHGERPNRDLDLRLVRNPHALTLIGKLEKLRVELAEVLRLVA